MNYVSGASLIVSRRFLQDVGLMCEDYFLYFEEADWAIRAKGRYSLAYAPKSIVYHKLGASIGTSSDPRKKSLVCDYYNIRNRIIFTRKFYPHALVSIYMVLMLSIMVRMLCGQWERIGMICRLMVSGGKDGKFSASLVLR
jgi:GT2 family glycosyltransferase